MPFLTADQLVVHLVGDYITQSDWMAVWKVRRALPALVHSVVYSAGFLVFGPSGRALTLILVSHFLIDRFRLARYLVWIKNFLGPFGCNAPWSECSQTGYPNARPDWLTVWLLIIADNILHITINGIALKCL